MLLRKDGSGVIAIPRPCHGWLSGQMARPRRKLAWFCSAPLAGFYFAVDPLGLDGVRLATAAFDRCWGFVAGDEMTREIETALREHGRAFGKLLGRAHDLDIAFHVLVRPATRVGDIGKLRKDEAQFGEETEHLACYRLNVVLPTDDDESRDLVTNENLIADRDGVLYAVQPTFTG
ncbi:MAG: hypothetical protein M3Z96_06990 [Pseudomonadota bacterium]|nr:hypothetical protein [Pseudomonadota bacterium]